MRRSTVAAAIVIGCFAVPARAHEPFSITTEARAHPQGLTLHVTMAGSTATLVCPGAAGQAHRLAAGDLEHHRAAFDACAKNLYVVTSVGQRLEPHAAAALTLTPEGDFDACLVYPAPQAGPLVFYAPFLARLPDPMYGAELTITGERVFLGGYLLRADTPSFTVVVPSGSAAPAEPRRGWWSHPYFRRAITLLVIGGCAWFLRRRFTSR